MRRFGESWVGMKDGSEIGIGKERGRKRERVQELEMKLRRRKCMMYTIFFVQRLFEEG